MAADRNKVLLELAGRPLLLYSIEALRSSVKRLVLVAASSEVEFAHALSPDALVVIGGATRHESERSALQALRGSLESPDVVAIHDAARPLVAPDDVLSVFESAERYGAAMLAAPASVPALEVQEGQVVRAYPAEQVWRAQTPQAARFGWLVDAYDRAAADGFDGTDTAAVLAHAGYPVRVVATSADNPKVTVPEDLALAERLLTERARGF